MEVRKSLIYLFIILFLAVVLGFFLFKYNMPKGQAVFQGKADAIVVLTGDEERIRVGFEMLNKKMSDVLFITGVYSRSGDEKLFRHYERLNENGQVVSGKFAHNTMENAKEFREFNERQKGAIKTIYLITDYYHMQRALLEFGKFNKNVNIYSYPIDYNANNKFLITLTEYLKYCSSHIWHLFNFENIKD
jgi:uncharacterized SAM-binding protein YcdF (DUF218 family)